MPALDTAPLADCDVLYVTRIQQERFADAREFARVRSTYQVSRQHAGTRARRCHRAAPAPARR